MNTAKFAALALVLLVALNAPNLHAQENKPTNFPRPNELPTLINATEYDKKDISVTTPDGKKVFKSPRDLEEEFEQGAKLYKKKKYKKAYPILAELSQWGIKSAQSLLGTMYIQGQHVDQSIERGLAWLGVAKELGGDKSTKKNFDYVYDQLNDEQKKFIDQKIADYISKYGAETQNITCKNKRDIGSNIPVKACVKTSGSNSPLYPIE